MTIKIVHGDFVRVTDADEFVLIDLETGTVLNDNVVAVKKSDFTKLQLEAISEDEEVAFKTGHEYGMRLYVRD